MLIPRDILKDNKSLKWILPEKKKDVYSRDLAKGVIISLFTSK